MERTHQPVMTKKDRNGFVGTAAVQTPSDFDVSQGVLLIDHYDESAALLLQSFRSSGFAGPAAVIADGGFLPDDVLSLYRWFCRDSGDFVMPAAVRKPEAPEETDLEEYRLKHAGFRPGKARFFNQIELPDYWEISADASSGTVHDLQNLRGRIFYSDPSGKRLVSDVDWLNEKGVVRFTDHYDSRGMLYSRTVFNRKGERFCRSWFDEYGRERVVENFVTGDIIVARNGKTRFFRNRTELGVSFLKEIGADGSRIFFNSLSVPFFISERMKRPEKGNVLFWQEEPRDDIPGNMQMILNGGSHTSEIRVQNRTSYERLAALGASSETVRPFGFLYHFTRENSGGRDALICTNSDQVEALTLLVEKMPDVTFHIAAVTEMSAKLLAFGRYANVRLYPVVKGYMIDELFDRCDYYLDINRGGEILSSVKRAFLGSQLILGLRGTLHRRRFTAPENIFPDGESLCRAFRETVSDAACLKSRLEMQKKAAMAEDVSSFRELYH